MHIGLKDKKDRARESDIQRNDDAGLDSDNENVNFLHEDVDNNDTVKFQQNDVDILT